MEWVKSFFVDNFILLCIGIIMLLNSFQRIRQHRRISIYTILIISCTLFLAVARTVENYCRNIPDPTWSLFFSIMGYLFRPVCLYLFILLALPEKKGKWFWLTALPLLAVFIIYSLGYVPGVREAVVYFTINGEGTYCIFHGGPLRYASHVISLGYLIWMIVISVSSLRRWHFNRGLTILGCALFVVLSVVLESFLNKDNSIYLLNSTIAVSTLFYYLHLYTEKTQIDTLTGLYNRETYYLDRKSMEKTVSGVILFDMNGLKYLNDHEGHAEGDKALSTIASCVLKAASRKMYVYRMGGDEYLLLASNCKEEEITSTISEFEGLLAQTPYHCSTGYAMKNDPSQTLDDLMKVAEEHMYAQKADYYKTAGIERRQH